MDYGSSGRQRTNARGQDRTASTIEEAHQGSFHSQARPFSNRAWKREGSLSFLLGRNWNGAQWFNAVSKVHACSYCVLRVCAVLASED